MYIVHVETVLDDNFITKTELIDSLISESISYLDKKIKTNYEKKYKDIPKNKQLLAISLSTKKYQNIKIILNNLSYFNKKHPKSVFYVHKIIKPNKKENILNNII